MIFSLQSTTSYFINTESIYFMAYNQLQFFKDMSVQNFEISQQGITFPITYPVSFYTYLNQLLYREVTEVFQDDLVSMECKT